MSNTNNPTTQPTSTTKYYTIFQWDSDAEVYKLVNEEYEWNGEIENLADEFATPEYEEVWIIPNEQVHRFRINRTTQFRADRIY